MVSVTTAGKVNIKAWQDNNLIAIWVIRKASTGEDWAT